MNANWQTFLQARGALIEGTTGVRFPDMPVESDCAICALDDLGVIQVTGEGTADFLQGQVSNDLRELSATRSQLSSHCNAKGRMLANFRVLPIENGFALIMQRDLTEKLASRLKMFVLRAKVRVADVSDEIVCLGLLGDCPRPAAEKHFGTLSDEANTVMRKAADALIRVAGPQPRWLFIGSPASAEAIWDQSCELGASQASAELWALQDIRAGIPVIRAATSELFVPQMTNLHLIDGVSFHKGCYTGQEVVARMQYLGKLKRRMYRAEIALSQAPAPGALLSSPASLSGQGAGAVVDARLNGRGHCELLAVAEIAAAERGDLTLPDRSDPLVLQPPPYGFPETA